MGERDFKLEPWEFVGADFDPAPHAIAEFEGAQFWLKLRENRVFFRLADDETRVWALTEEFQGERGQIADFWREEIGAGRFGRFVLTQMRFASRHYSTTMCSLVTAGRKIWSREWCGGPWRQLSRRLAFGASSDLWASDWRAEGIEGVIRENAKLFAEREMDPAERIDMPLTWVKGTAEEFERVVGWLFRTLPSPRKQYQERRWELRARAANPCVTFAIQAPWLLRARGGHWRIVLEREFCVVGFQWRYCYWPYRYPFSPGQSSPPPLETRSAWLIGQLFTSPLLLPDVSTISAHDRLEARLNLRDWLRAKGRDAEIPKLLGQ